MGIFNEFNKKEKPLFTGLHFGFGSGGGSTGPGVFSASGGAKIETGGYVYHLFYDGLSGSDNFEVASGSATITYVCVAGGGGGGCGKTILAPNHYSGGGGGAGGYRTGTASVTAGTFPVTVGTGGAGVSGPPSDGFGDRGGNTTFGLSSPVVATGGGGGENRTARSNGGATNTTAANHMPGGSGGGNGERPNYNRGLTVASPDNISPTAQGNNGGFAGADGQACGGGGGAGAAGGDGASPGSPGQGNGGAGGNGSPTVFPGPGLYPQLPSPYSNGLGTAWRDALGTPGAVAGGGGGAYGYTNNNHSAGGDGGSGGGGDAAQDKEGTGSDGVDGTGGGGGGGATQQNTTPGAGGDGGNGCVMIRYPA